MNDTKIPANKACIFGDRLNTDIIAGNRAGIKSIAVLTGVTTFEMIEDLKVRIKKSQDIDKNLIPDITLKSLDEIFKE